MCAVHAAARGRPGHPGGRRRGMLAHHRPALRLDLWRRALLAAFGRAGTRAARTCDRAVAAEHRRGRDDRRDRRVHEPRAARAGAAGQLPRRGASSRWRAGSNRPRRTCRSGVRRWTSTPSATRGRPRSWPARPVISRSFRCRPRCMRNCAARDLPRPARALRNRRAARAAVEGPRARRRHGGARSLRTGPARRPRELPLGSGHGRGRRGFGTGSWSRTTSSRRAVAGGDRRFVATIPTADGDGLTAVDGAAFAELFVAASRRSPRRSTRAPRPPGRPPACTLLPRPDWFLLSVLWFDLMFDVQARRPRVVDLPAAVRDSIAASTGGSRHGSAHEPMGRAGNVGDAGALVGRDRHRRCAAGFAWASLRARRIGRSASPPLHLPTPCGSERRPTTPRRRARCALASSATTLRASGNCDRDRPHRSRREKPHARRRRDTHDSMSW